MFSGKFEQSKDNARPQRPSRRWKHFKDMYQAWYFAITVLQMVWYILRNCKSAFENGNKNKERILEKKVKELESIIGKQTIVIEMLKIASDLKEVVDVLVEEKGLYTTEVLRFVVARIITSQGHTNEL